MRIFAINSQSVDETDHLPIELPQEGFLWMAFGRREFELLQHQVQDLLDKFCHAQMVDLHVQDVLNNQLPSHYLQATANRIYPDQEKYCIAHVSAVGLPCCIASTPVQWHLLFLNAF